MTLAFADDVQAVQARLLLVLPYFPGCKWELVVTEMLLVVFDATPIYHLYDKGRFLAAPLRLWRLPGQARAQPGFCHMAPRSGQPLIFGTKLWFFSPISYVVCHI